MHKKLNISFCILFKRFPTTLQRIYDFGLSVCAYSNSCTYSNASKLISVTQVYCSMFSLENGIYKSIDSSIGTHKSILQHYDPWAEYFLSVF